MSFMEIAGLVFLVLTGAVLVGAWFYEPPRARSAGIAAVVTVVCTATVSPLVMAFAAKLGERLGARVSVERLPWWRRRPGREEIIVTPPRAFGRVVTLEMEAGLSDEARLALIELDVGRPELWGHRLRWDEDVQAWLPVPDRHPGEERTHPES